MRWLTFIALLCLCSRGPSWAVPFSVPFWEALSSSSSTGPLPEASARSSASPSATWERLDDLLSQLESSAEDSNADSLRLRESLGDARSRLSELSARLTESSTRAAGLSSSLELCERSLALCEASLREARVASARRDTELWIWRGAAILGVVVGAAGLGWGFANASAR